MKSKEGWTTVVVAAIGMVGTVLAGLIGYQSGSMSVDKDYVQMAISNLNNENSSPELRRWSVAVLNDLAPIPLTKELQEQLVTTSFVAPEIPIPDTLKEPCPDLIEQLEKRVEESGQRIPSEEIRETLVLEYQRCRVRYETLLEYIGEVNRINRGTKSEIEAIIEPSN